MTAYVERFNLTFRELVAPLSRTWSGTSSGCAPIITSRVRTSPSPCQPRIANATALAPLPWPPA